MIDIKKDETIKNPFIHRLEDYREQLNKRREEGLIRGEHVGFSTFHDYYSVKKGSTTYIIAPPGSGKTYITYEMILNLAEFHDYKVAIFSPEGGSPTDLFAEMLWSYLRVPFQKTKDMPNIPEATDEEVERGYKFMQEHFYIIDSGLREMNPVKYFEAIRDIEAEDGVKIDACVIDPVLEININPDNLREDIALNGFLTKIRKFSSENQIHTFIAIHTRAMGTVKGTLNTGEEIYYQPQPTFYDAAGGQTYSRKGYMIMSLWRPHAGLPKPDASGEYYVKNELVVEVLKVKPKIMGKLGKVSLHFDYLSSRFFEDVDGERLHSRDITKESSKRDAIKIPI